MTAVVRESGRATGRESESGRGSTARHSSAGECERRHTADGGPLCKQRAILGAGPGGGGGGGGRRVGASRHLGRLDRDHSLTAELAPKSSIGWLPMDPACFTTAPSSHDHPASSIYPAQPVVLILASRSLSARVCRRRCGDRCCAINGAGI